MLITRKLICNTTEFVYNHTLQQIVKNCQLLYTRATQLISTKIQLEKFSISRDPVEFLIGNNKNETIITNKYRKLLDFLIVYSNHQNQK